MLNVCSLMVNDTYEDAVSYVESKGVSLDDAWEDITCGNYGSSLISFVVSRSKIRSLLLIRRHFLRELEEPDRFLKLINTIAPFNSTSNQCPLGVTYTMLASNPDDIRMQKLQTLLAEWGATRECSAVEN
jgi:hypothetical protein